MSGGKADKRTAAKRKTAKRATSSKPKAKSKTPKRKVAKKKSVKRKATIVAKRAGAPKVKRAGAKKKAAKKKTSAVKRSAVKKVVSAAKKAAKGKRSATGIERLIFSELENLAGYIHDAKQEIASIRPDEVKDDFLPKAEIELGAIVEATAEATHTIMDACDGLDGLMSTLNGDAAATLMDATTKIYEACTFQDITGQRINKVVKTLQHIDERIDRLIKVFGVKIEKSNSTEQQNEHGAQQMKVSDEDLLEGPQLKGRGKSQAEIDDLLASFD